MNINITITLTGTDLINIDEICTKLERLKNLSNEEIESNFTTTRFKIRNTELLALGLSTETWKVLSNSEKKELLKTWPDRHAEFCRSKGIKLNLESESKLNSEEESKSSLESLESESKLNSEEESKSSLESLESESDLYA